MKKKLKSFFFWPPLQHPKLTRRRKAAYRIPDSDFLLFKVNYANWIRECLRSQFYIAESIESSSAWICYMRWKTLQKRPRASAAWICHKWHEPRESSTRRAFRCSLRNEIESRHLAIRFKHRNKVIEQRIIGMLLSKRERIFLSVQVSRGTDFRFVLVWRNKASKSERERMKVYRFSNEV